MNSLKLENQKLQYSADYEKQKRSDYAKELELKYESLVECKNMLSKAENKCKSL